LYEVDDLDGETGEISDEYMSQVEAFWADAARKLQPLALYLPYASSVTGVWPDVMNAQDISSQCVSTFLSFLSNPLLERLILYGPFGDPDCVIDAMMTRLARSSPLQLRPTSFVSL
jgi:hypothetical protein